MSVLVDSSAWITYFRSGSNADNMDFLIDENLIATNDLILTELIPYLKLQRQSKLISLLTSMARLPLDIDWGELQTWQTRCLRKGINGIGIPDLIIAQNCRQNKAKLYSEDKHFPLIRPVTRHKTYQ